MSRWRSPLLWVLAVLLTLASVIYQRRTGPTYPVRSEVQLQETEFTCKLLRSHETHEDMPVHIDTNDPGVHGTVLWKRYKTEDAISAIPMTYTDGALQAAIPAQPAAGKVEYQVLLEKNGEQRVIPDEPAVARFKGAVPAGVLIPHILFMFTAMLLASRVLLAALAGEALKTKVWLTFIFLSIGGLILGPIVQKHAFDAYWTGWPFGEDLTDNKTLVAFLAWLPVLWFLRDRDRPGRARWWALGAAVIMFAVYLIPHSMRGSELDYSALPRESSQPAAIKQDSSTFKDSTISMPGE